MELIKYLKAISQGRTGQVRLKHSGSIILIQTQILTVLTPTKEMCVCVCRGEGGRGIWAHFTGKEAEDLKDRICLEDLMVRLRIHPSPGCAPQNWLKAGGGAWWEGDLGPVLAVPPGTGVIQRQAFPCPGLPFLTGQGQSRISMAAPSFPIHFPFFYELDKI